MHLIGGKSHLSCPLAHGQSFALKFNQAIGPNVIALFGSCCPFAIGAPSLLFALLAVTTGVMAVVIDSLYGVFGAGAWSYILQEMDKVLSPMSANPYAPCTIIFIVILSLVLAASNDTSVNCVLSCLTESVGCVSVDNGFNVQTTTTSSCSVLQEASFGYSKLAAIASAKPLRLPSLVGTSKAKDRQAPKDAAGPVSYFGASYRHYLWDIVRGIIGAHRNPIFLCQSPGRLPRRWALSIGELPLHYSTNGLFAAWQFADRCGGVA